MYIYEPCQRRAKALAGQNFAVMIDYIKGELTELAPTEAIVEAAGVGYALNISLNTFSAIQGKTDVKLYVHESLVTGGRDDSFTLYGFSTKQEREFYRLLITVSGVGANTARMILSAMSPAELANAITNGDERLLKGVKGIGLKTAQKLVVDLKGRFKNELPVSEISSGKLNSSNLEMAVLFAQSTGISRTQCMNALSKTKLPDDADVDLIIDSIFKNLNF